MSNTMHPIEDRVFKNACRFFGEELLPQLGIDGTIIRVAPTEQVQLEVRDYNQDFNFEMADGTWKHFEFESDSITDQDLSRFRVYEATTSYFYDVEITTYVICTADTKSLKDELQCGINRYRVIVIRMKDEDADAYISSLEQKMADEPLTKEGLIKLVLTPVMGGDMTIKERIDRSLTILQKAKDYISKQDLQQMISMLYAFATKFLDQNNLQECKGRFHMTYLGELLVDEGRKEERQNISINLRKTGMSVEEISQIVQDSTENVIAWIKDAGIPVE